MRKLFFCIVLFLMPTAAYAECVATGCNKVKITMIYVRTAMTIFGTNGTESQLTNCTPDAGKFLVLDNTHDNSEKVYALLLLAYSSNLDVNIVVRPDDNNLCKIVYAYVGDNQN